MAALSNNPTNKNFLSPTAFKFEIARMPTFTYFVQSVQFPELNLGYTDLNTPFNRLSVEGDHTKFGNLNVTFKLDEDMYSYLEIYDWMTGVGKPRSFDQYANLKYQDAGTGKGLYSEGQLTFLTNSKNPNINITFADMYPINLGNFRMDSTVDDVNYVTADVTFNFFDYVYSRI
jgi:hypothetical protein